MVSEQNSQIKYILHWNIYRKLPVKSICHNLEGIESVIREIEHILYNLQTQVEYLTPVSFSCSDAISVLNSDF